MDHFYEQLVTTSKTGIYKIVSGGTYVFAFIAITIFKMNLIVAIALLVLAGACFYFKQNLFVEYEYQFTNGEIDIEKILEMKKRRKVVTFNIKEVALIAQEDSHDVKDFSNKPSVIVKCFPSTTKSTVYVAMVTEGNTRMQLKFIPDEKFLEHCFKYNPRAVKK